jgi:hypothetical protein
VAAPYLLGGLVARTTKPETISVLFRVPSSSFLFRIGSSQARYTARFLAGGAPFVTRQNMGTRHGCRIPLGFGLSKGAGFDVAFSCSSRIYKNHSPALIAVQPSFSTVHCKTLNQSLLPCYPSPMFAKPHSASSAQIAADHALRLNSYISLTSKSCAFLSFADPHSLSLLKSYRFRNIQGRGYLARSEPNSFSCNTYGSPRKCCKQKTYGLAKSFRCNTYKKPGWGRVIVS